MQTAGFNFPLATYLVLPETELPGSEFGGGVAVVEQEKLRRSVGPAETVPAGAVLV